MAERELLSPREFRERVRRKYADEFAVHREIAETLEAVVLTNRPLSTHVQRALDMLMTQAYKSHHAVWLLCERAQAEDAATLTRRLMELAVQGIYIGENDDEAAVAERAGCYLAWLWREAPDELKAHVPEPMRSYWQDITQRYLAKLPKGKRWGPNFRDMFVAIGRLDTYEEDYRLLSAVAHGSAEESMLHYSMRLVDLRSDLHVPALLVYSSRYYLAVAGVWNRHLKRLDGPVLNRLLERVNTVRAKYSDDQNETPES